KNNRRSDEGQSSQKLIIANTEKMSRCACFSSASAREYGRIVPLVLFFDRLDSDMQKKEGKERAEEARRENCTERRRSLDEPAGVENEWHQHKGYQGGRAMRRIGILSFSSPGHFYPLTALGRRLQ